MTNNTSENGAEKNGSDRRAVAYLRTSSRTNVEGDSAPRQREAVAAYAKRAGIEIVQEFYDAAVQGADMLGQRAGFAAMLAFAHDQGIRTIIVENATRFARDLIVQETGFAMLQARGVTLIAADHPKAFTSDTPTAVMVRQILGAVAQFQKAVLVAQMRGARDRMSVAAGHRIEGRKSLVETNPTLLREARRLARKNPRTGATRSLREIAGELVGLGFTTAGGKPFSASQVARLLGSGSKMQGK